MPKLTLRDLFWLLLVVAMGCAWWVDRSRLANDNERLVKEKNQLANDNEKLLVLDEARRDQVEALFRQLNNKQTEKDP